MLIYNQQKESKFKKEEQNMMIRKAAEGDVEAVAKLYEDIHTARICLAFSPNGITNWTRSAENPIVEPTPDSWDANACYKPSAVRDEAHNRWLLWYNGRRDHSEYIGLVVHDGLDLR